MATMDYWAEAPISRMQIALFAATFDAMISEYDRSLDFSKMFLAGTGDLWRRG